MHNISFNQEFYMDLSLIFKNQSSVLFLAKEMDAMNLNIACVCSNQRKCLYKNRAILYKIGIKRRSWVARYDNENW